MKNRQNEHSYFNFTGHYCRVPRCRRRSRLALSFFCLLLLVTQAKAQFLGGFFSQQSSKEKLMAEQVVGYQTYLGAIKGGYQIAATGLNTAHELKGGTFGLHTAYFNSLEQVNPVIQQNPKGKAISDLHTRMLAQLDKEISWQTQQKQFTPAELAYLQKVADNLKTIGAADMGELGDILTPGKLQLTDQQRLDRLDKLYAAMKDKAAFAASFTDKCRQLATSRQRSKAEKEQIRKLYGIQ